MNCINPIYELRTTVHRICQHTTSNCTTNEICYNLCRQLPAVVGRLFTNNAATTNRQIDKIMLNVPARDYWLMSCHKHHNLSAQRLLLVVEFNEFFFSNNQFLLRVNGRTLLSYGNNDLETGNHFPVGLIFKMQYDFPLTTMIWL